MTERKPPTRSELNHWRSLRSLAAPGPETLKTVYRIAFPVLLDEYDYLTKENIELRTRLRDDARRYLDDTCLRIYDENLVALLGDEDHERALKKLKVLLSS